MTAAAEPLSRHARGRVVATLSRRVGVQHLDAVEDAVQRALTRALETWPTRGAPDDPEAWVFRVAHRGLLDELRTGARRRRLLDAASPAPAPEAPDAPALRTEMQDGLLRMLFAACDEALPVPSRIAFTLRVLCGFEVREIAARFFASEAAIQKRLTRARAALRATPTILEDLDAARLEARRPIVLGTLYVLFTEGYLSSHPQAALRQDLCDEALRLTALLAAHPVGDAPETDALLALMHLHAARSAARVDATGGLRLLEEQDRATWDMRHVQEGLTCLARSARGTTLSRYHLEAGIAAEHALAPSFAETRWAKVVEGYRALEQVAPSPLHRLNRAVAVAEAEGPEAALRVLEGFAPPSWLAGSYLWAAVLADLYRRQGDAPRAARHRAAAIAQAPNEAVRALLARRLGEVGNAGAARP